MDSVNHHLENAYRPQSRLVYQKSFRTFLAFVVFVGRLVFQILGQDILMSIQILVFNNLSYPSILNYISALKFKFQWYNLPVSCLQNSKLSLFLRSLKVNVRRLPRVKGTFDISTLNAICSACDLVSLYIFFFLFSGSAIWFPHCLWRLIFHVTSVGLMFWLTTRGLQS